VWYYLDPEGAQQGPCSIKQFKGWVAHMRAQPKLSEQLQQFQLSPVWQAGEGGRRGTLFQVLCNYP
jgi:hypothetical protein